MNINEPNGITPELLLGLARNMGITAHQMVKEHKPELAGLYAYLAFSYAMDADPTYREVPE